MNNIKVIAQKIIVYIPLPSVITVDASIKACLKPSTKYVNGKALNIFTNLSSNILKFQTIGVNHIQSCITIVSNCAKSGTKVVRAEVNLVSAIMKHNAQNTIYITFIKFGMNPYKLEAITAIAIKNIPIKLAEVSEIIGITSTGKTTFLTR